MEVRGMKHQPQLNENQSPNLEDLATSLAVVLTSEQIVEEVWFSPVDSKNAYRQLTLCDELSEESILVIVGGEALGIYRSMTRFSGLLMMMTRMDCHRNIDSLFMSQHFFSFPQIMYYSWRNEQKTRKETNHLKFSNFLIEKNNLNKEKSKLEEKKNKWFDAELQEKYK